MKKAMFPALLAAAMVVFQACSSNQVLATLQASVAAAEVLVVALEGAGKIPAPLATQIETAIGGLPAAYQRTAEELSSSDDAALKAAKIANYYATSLAALKALPPQAQFYTVAVTTSVEAFLGKLRMASDGPAPKVMRGVRSIPAPLQEVRSRASELERRVQALRSGQTGVQQ